VAASCGPEEAEPLEEPLGAELELCDAPLPLELDEPDDDDPDDVEPLDDDPLDDPPPVFCPANGSEYCWSPAPWACTAGGAAAARAKARNVRTVVRPLEVISRQG
jgi:hypothetical protein